MKILVSGKKIVFRTLIILVLVFIISYGGFLAYRYYKIRTIIGKGMVYGLVSDIKGSEQLVIKSLNENVHLTIFINSQTKFYRVEEVSQNDPGLVGPDGRPIDKISTYISDEKTNFQSIILNQFLTISFSKVNGKITAQEIKIDKLY